MSKGSKQRPYDKEQFDTNYDKIFCKHNYYWKEDGDIGSGWFCKKCNHRRPDSKPAHWVLGANYENNAD